MSAAPLKDAHRLMREHHFRHLPVTRADAIVGVLTDRDIKLVGIFTVTDACGALAEMLAGSGEPPDDAA